jgi:glucokinase
MKQKAMIHKAEEGGHQAELPIIPGGTAHPPAPILAGDVGGTKSTLAIFSPKAGPRAPLVEATFPSGNYPSLERVAQEFLAQTGIEVGVACFGVAGPVLNGRATITNLPWVMDEVNLAQTLGLARVRLLNDLVATAQAIPLLTPPDLYMLNAGKPTKGGAIAVIAPGTGLGEAYLTWDGSRYIAHPSEGGHANFGPSTPLEMGLLRYLQDRFGHVSYERVCSGIGIPNIYAYLKEHGHAEEPAWLAAALAVAQDPTPIIVNGALTQENPCPICATTLSMFIAILGTEAANLTLKVMASGGLYLGGGIPPRILPALETGHFLAAFRHKGRFSDLLATIPIHVILDPKVALYGAAHYGLEFAATELFRV